VRFVNGGMDDGIIVVQISFQHIGTVQGHADFFHMHAHPAFAFMQNGTFHISQTTAAVLRMKDSTMETVSKVQEQATGPKAGEQGGHFPSVEPIVAQNFHFQGFP